MDQEVDFESFELASGKFNVGSRGVTMISNYGIGHINATSKELKALGEFLIAYANKADELEDCHPMGQS